MQFRLLTTVVVLGLTLVFIAPTLYAALIYMVFSRLIRGLNAESLTSPFPLSAVATPRHCPSDFIKDLLSL
jgi:hypothetical protein